MNSGRNSFAIAEMIVGSSTIRPAGLPLPSISVEETPAGWLIASENWTSLAIADRLALLRRLLCVAWKSSATALQWQFSDVSLDGLDIDFALSHWADGKVPLLSLIDLRHRADGIESKGLDAIVGRELVVHCAPEWSEAAMILLVHAAHHLLDGKSFQIGQQLVSEDLSGIVVEDGADGAIWNIVLVTSPNLDGTAFAN